MGLVSKGAVCIYIYYTQTISTLQNQHILVGMFRNKHDDEIW